VGGGGNTRIHGGFIRRNEMKNTKSKMIALVVVILMITSSGCESVGAISDKGMRELAKKRELSRANSFRECMELSSKILRQSDDSVSEIVRECSSQAYFMSTFVDVDMK
jgi:hypothetical protein